MNMKSQKTTGYKIHTATKAGSTSGNATCNHYVDLLGYAHQQCEGSGNCDLLGSLITYIPDVCSGSIPTPDCFAQ